MPGGWKSFHFISLALSADGKRLFSGSGDNTIKVWDLKSGKETLTLNGYGVDRTLALSVDGKRLFSKSGDTTIKVWDVEAELAHAAKQQPKKKN